MASQLLDGKWRIESLQGQQDQVEARRRYDYVSLMPKLALCCLFADCLYLSYRILLVKRASQVDVAVYIALFIEISFAATSGLLHLQSLSAWGKAKFQLPLRLQGTELPTVDVLLPCCGEDLKVIMNTVRAACVLDYPSEQYRIIVLDDGHSDHVYDGVNSLIREKGYRNLHYTSRNVEIKVHSRAANLNFGLEYAATLEPGLSDFIAVLDIDMIPLPYWLRAMLPYIVRDEKVALANPAQRFYNIPNRDPFVQNVDFVFDGMETIKDCVSASWCTGTGFVVRRQALAQIHWFPTAKHNDDIMTSLYLTAAGWKIVYVPETVQWGLVPDTVRKHVRQRTKWIAAFIYYIFALGDERSKGHATLQQRIGAAMPAVVIIITNAIIAFSAAAVPWMMLSGSPTVAYQSVEELRRLLLLESLSFVAAFAAGLTRSRAAHGNGEIFLSWEQVGLAPFQAITIAQTTFSEVFGTKAPSFAPDNTSKSSQLPLWSRSVIRSFNVDLLSHTFILLLHLYAAYIGWHAVSAGSGIALQHDFWSKGGYPAVFLLCVKYILQTAPRIPSMVNGQPLCSSPASLLTSDVKSGVLYPSDRAKSAARTGPAQTFAILAVLYHGVVLISACMWS